MSVVGQTVSDDGHTIVSITVERVGGPDAPVLVRVSATGAHSHFSASVKMMSSAARDLAAYLAAAAQVGRPR